MENKTNINWYPGHMAKTKKQIIEDLKLIDIVIEVLDARAPKASRNIDLEQYLTNKIKIIALNKADLADENVTKKWIEYYEKQGTITVAIESSTGKGINNIISKIKESYKSIEEKYIKKGRIGRPARVMVIGIPNVGKSTFINSLSKRSTAKVGNRPGVTTQKQWIKIDQNIELMDTPGMLWPRMNDDVETMHLAYVNTIGDAAIDKDEVSFYLLKYLILNYAEKVEERYDININEILKKDETKEDKELKDKEQLVTKKEIEDIKNVKEIIDSTEKINNIKISNDDVIKIREKIAERRGAILPGGRINQQKLSDIILTDFQSGKIGKISIESPKV